MPSRLADSTVMRDGAFAAARILVHSMRLLPFAIALAGGASLTHEQCLHAGWRQIGFSDGTQELSGAHIEDHAKATPKHVLSKAYVPISMNT